jgi:hypothetical protein
MAGEPFVEMRNVNEFKGYLNEIFERFYSTKRN